MIQIENKLMIKMLPHLLIIIIMLIIYSKDQIQAVQLEDFPQALKVYKLNEKFYIYNFL